MVQVEPHQTTWQQEHAYGQTVLWEEYTQMLNSQNNCSTHVEMMGLIGMEQPMVGASCSGIDPAGAGQVIKE